MSFLKVALQVSTLYLSIGVFSAIWISWQIRRSRKMMDDFWSGNSGNKPSGTQGLLLGMGIQVIKDKLDEWDARPWYSKTWYFLREVLTWPLTLLFRICARLGEKE